MKIKIATRKSKLALWQANFVKAALEKHYPTANISLVEIVTEGDRQPNGTLSAIGGKALFVKALQKALLNHEADIAVHSIKDMSVHPTAGLLLSAILKRMDARDAFISTHFSTIASLPIKAIIGTSSPRRACIIQSLRPDCIMSLLRGNVDTRLAKLDAGNYDAIILAAAGLTRLGLAERITDYFSEETMIPAIGQGAIGIECRDHDTTLQEMLQFLHDEKTAICIHTERAVNQLLGGDCHTPLGAHAKMINDQLQLSAMVGSEDGKIILRATKTGNLNEHSMIAKSVVEALLTQGARQLLK